MWIHLSLVCAAPPMGTLVTLAPPGEAHVVTLAVFRESEPGHGAPEHPAFSVVHSRRARTDSPRRSRRHRCRTADWREARYHVPEIRAKGNAKQCNELRPASARGPVSRPLPCLRHRAIAPRIALLRAPFSPRTSNFTVVSKQHVLPVVSPP